MDLSLNLKFNSISFNSRYTKFSKENMDKVLLPLLKNENIEFKDMVKMSGYTNHALLKWFKESFGISASDYFKNRYNEKLKQQMLSFYNNGASLKEVAEYFDRSQKWVYNQYLKFGFKLQREAFEEKISEELPKLLAAGHTIDSIVKILKCSKTKLARWINKNIGSGIVQYRQKHNIVAERRGSNIKNEIELIKEHLISGKSVTEIARILKYPLSKIIWLKQKYGLKSEFDNAHERMEKLVPEMIKDKLSLRKMSLVIGLSAATIRRWIRNTYGKKYLDIRLNK